MTRKKAYRTFLAAYDLQYPIIWSDYPETHLVPDFESASQYPRQLKFPTGPLQHPLPQRPPPTVWPFYPTYYRPGYSCAVRRERGHYDPRRSEGKDYVRFSRSRSPGYRHKYSRAILNRHVCGDIRRAIAYEEFDEELYNKWSRYYEDQTAEFHIAKAKSARLKAFCEDIIQGRFMGPVDYTLTESEAAFLKKWFGEEAVFDLCEMVGRM